MITIKDNNIPSWIISFLEKDLRHWIWQDGILILDDCSWQEKEKSLTFYNDIGGVEQHRLAHNPDHASFYDYPRYNQLIQKMFSLNSHNPNLAIDLGCGDGRCTQLLLDNNIQRIISIDFHFPSLQRLVKYISGNAREKVVPLYAPLTLEPISEIQVDIAICAEVLCTLPQPDEGFKALKKWLKGTNGIFLVIEPAIEGSMIYALIEENNEIIYKILKEHKRYDKVGDSFLEVHLQTQSSLSDFISRNKCKILYQKSIPAGAALTIFSLKKACVNIQQNELELINVANQLEEFSPRMHSIIAQVL